MDNNNKKSYHFHTNVKQHFREKNSIFSLSTIFVFHVIRLFVVQLWWWLWSVLKINAWWWWWFIAQMSFPQKNICKLIASFLPYLSIYNWKKYLYVVLPMHKWPFQCISIFPCPLFYLNLLDEFDLWPVVVGGCCCTILSNQHIYFTTQ